MNVSDIILKFLSEYECDGLCNPDLECGCGLDDFVPCDCNLSDCVPAKKTNCIDCSEQRNCGIQTEYECDFCYRVAEIIPEGGEE